MMISEEKIKQYKETKFKRGDVIHVIGGSSLEWIKPVPLVVIGYLKGDTSERSYPVVTELDGSDPTRQDSEIWWNHARDEDCSLDVFITAARRANGL